jgi:hypothetical protein
MNYGADLSTLAQGEAVKLAFSRILGFTPNVQYTDTHAKITLTPEQNKIAATWFSTMMDQPDTGGLDINALPIILPWTTKKFLPFAAIGIILLLFIGYKLGR